VKFLRMFRHLCATRLSTRRHFTDAVDAAIESAIGTAESRCTGEIRFVIETALDIPELGKHQKPLSLSALHKIKGHPIPPYISYHAR
jgi:hypothetical protein